MKNLNSLLDRPFLYWFIKRSSHDRAAAADYESHQRILFLFSRALINRDLVTSFMMNAIIIIVPSFIMRGYLGGIIHGDRSCCLMHQALWASDPAIAYTRESAVCRDVEILLMEILLFSSVRLRYCLCSALQFRAQSTAAIIRKFSNCNSIIASATNYSIN